MKQELCSNPPIKSAAQYFKSTLKEIVSPGKIKCSNINADTFYTFVIPVPEDVRGLYVLQNKNGSIGNCLIDR